MRILAAFLIVMSCLGSQGYSQDRGSFGIYGGPAFPGGDIDSFNGMGAQFGIIGRIATSNPILMFSLGGSITRLSSEPQSTYYGYPMGTIRLTDDYDPISFFAGVQIGKEKGVYFLPAIAWNIAESSPRVGMDLRIGGLIPFEENSCFDLGVKMSVLNLLFKETDENTNALLLFFVGIAF